MPELNSTASADIQRAAGPAPAVSHSAPHFQPAALREISPGSVLAPDTLLDAFENYTGSIADLDRGIECNGGALRSGRDLLVKELRSHGLAAGDRVVVSVGNGPTFLTALVSILSAGASPLLLHAETPPGELQRFALSIGARFILCDGQTPDTMAPVSASAELLEFLILGPLTWATVDERHSEFEREFPSLESVPLHPTSGSTGRPKIAVRPAAVAIAEALNYRDTLEITAADRLLCVVPMSHAYGFGSCVTAPLVSGASVVATRKFNPRAVQKALAEQAITIFPAVPAMLDLLLLAAANGLGRVPRRVLSAGAPLPERTAQNFLEKTGVSVAPLYGTTETGAISVGVDGSRPSTGACVGQTMRRVSVEIRPIAGETSLEPGLGRVCVKSPSMMAGYLTREGIDSTPVVRGWLETGDLGFLDSDRQIHLVAREKEVINVFGMKVIPGEVESVIAAFPQIADVKVYAGAHRTGSQIVKAAIAGPETLDLAALKEYCREHLAPYKRPEIVTRLDALPRTPTGKIIRDRLP